ncbi:type IV pilus biogenesis/stability protein PilW [Marinihelvus fidelis]|uniref:Type IV pilus biogenesis/stability protein PilW n=1 Tax=Marinihelvus fidelis TaxID=2613842 RepID=A0A5N0TFJ3_9GAMM|nr:type IV pilus biogenesis/stability protein PilW [Marinihelvus fidelis]KAA9132029.1 type IV pilus biogenesis/stability protein PilW [Marinihelvus fidelis]
MFPSRLIAIMLTTAILAGCASSPDTDTMGGPTDPARRAAEINTRLGTEYMNRGQYEIALEKLKRAVRSDNDYAPAHTVIAVLYERIGEYELAGKHYKEAVRAKPDSGDANNNYAAYLCRSNRSREAQEYFERALDDPFYRTPAVALANAGSCALEHGDMDAAENYLRQSLKYDAAFPDALLSMAGLSYRKSDFLRARAFLQRYEATGTTSVEGLMVGYRVETRLNNPEGASAYRNQIFDRYPNSPEAEQIRMGTTG